jgi:hypothetical protein
LWVLSKRLQHDHRLKASAVYSTRFARLRVLDGYSLSAMIGRYTSTAKQFGSNINKAWVVHSIGFAHLRSLLRVSVNATFGH